jgi:hypothetical protein
MRPADGSRLKGLKIGIQWESIDDSQWTITYCPRLLQAEARINTPINFFSVPSLKLFNFLHQTGQEQLSVESKNNVAVSEIKGEESPSNLSVVPYASTIDSVTATQQAPSTGELATNDSEIPPKAPRVE